MSSVEHPLSNASFVRFGSVAASGLKNLNDCFQSDPAVDARFLRFSIELSAPGPQAATEFSCLAVGNRPVADARLLKSRRSTERTQGPGSSNKRFRIVASHDLTLLVRPHSAGFGRIVRDRASWSNVHHMNACMRTVLKGLDRLKPRVIFREYDVQTFGHCRAKYFAAARHA